MKTVTCHPDRKHKAKGLCLKCYRQLPESIASAKKAKDKYRQSKKGIEVQKIYSKNYRNKDKVAAYLKSEEYKQDRKDSDLKYRRSNKGLKYQRDYKRNRAQEDLQFRLTARLRSRINNALYGKLKVGSAIKDMGSTVEFLKTYLETLWQPGMSWDNYGYRGWHVDHIKPLSSFDLTNPEQFKQACHYTNLQPLWAEDNLKKSDNYESV